VVWHRLKEKTAILITDFDKPAWMQPKYSASIAKTNPAVGGSAPPSFKNRC
jgi:hypothetical protein